MARNLANQLWQSFLQLNLYKKSSSDAQTTPTERFATRIYVCSLAITILTIAIASAFLVRTVNKTEYSPSRTKFAELIAEYPDNLHCPCSSIGIAYNTFVTTHVTFHQVCSSDFIRQKWFDMVYAEYNISSLQFDDFRLTLSFFWQLIAGFCVMSNRTWTDTVISFGASHIFSPIAIAEELIQTKVKTTLDNQLTSAQTILARNLLFIRRTISANQMASALATNYYLRYLPSAASSSTSVMMSPRTFSNCSCLSIEGCPRTATFNNSLGYATTIKGMIADCLIIDGTLASTFECYYDQACLSLLHPSSSMLIKPLSDTANKHFIINSTIQMLVNELMVDEIINEIRFDLFYSQCNPAYCSYSYAHRFDSLFVITTIISVFGGLSFIIRFIAPFIAAIVLRCKQRGIPNNNVQHATPTEHNQSHVVLNRFPLLLNYIRQIFVNLNVFEQQTPRTLVNIFRERLLTRIFIFLIIILSAAAGVYTFFVIQDQIVTIEHPSFDTYQQLYNDHLDALQCPCSQVSVPYEDFLNVTVILHQVCSSDFVSPIWLNYLVSFDPIFVPSWTIASFSRDFRSIGASYFQVLSTFCSLAKNSIEDAQYIFSNTRYINAHVLSGPLFDQQTQVMIKSYIDNTRNDFDRTIDWISTGLIMSSLVTGANTNIDITVSNNDILITADPVYYTGAQITHYSFSVSSPCSCPTDDRMCFILALLYTNGTNFHEYDQIFSELPIGCTPLNGFLPSKFTWWYDKAYLENIKATYAIVIDSQPKIDIKSLNSSVSTRFDDVNLEYLFREMFTESWISNGTYFNEFYSNCAPLSCSYTIRGRRDLIVILFLFISICGGLNSILQILVPAFGKLIFFFIDWRKNQDIQHPLPSITIRLNQLFHNIFKSIINTNLYKTTSTNEVDVKQQKLYTRIYLVLFVSSLSALLFYNAIIERSITKTHVQPSVTDYEYLLDRYSDDINCPCTHISIPYDDLVTNLEVARFHQACATGVIASTLTVGSYSQQGTNYYYEKDFRNHQNVFISSLNQLCILAQESISNSINIFLASTMFVNQLMSRTYFNNEINVTLNQFKQKVPIEFARTLNLIRTTVQGNALIGLYSTNWQFVVAEKGKGENASFRSEPVSCINTDKNISWSCATSQICTMPAQTFWYDGTLQYTFEGIVLGCYSLETLLLSSLSCFYSMICINNFRHALQIDNIDLMEYSNRTGEPIQLDASWTRFNTNDTIETLAYEMFIESWTNNVSYERFFNSCATRYCTYKLYYRFDTLEILTTFLSVYAGLSLVILFIVPYLIKILKKFRNRFRVTPLQ